MSCDGAAGPVERAFASVRLVQANVGAGGEWLAPHKRDRQVYSCAVESATQWGCVEGCLNRAMRYECALETCPCGTRCTNRRMRSGSAVSTAVIDYGRKGVGVVALEPIETDEYVGEYVGEVLTSGEATLRAEKYRNEPHVYLLQVSRNRVIDATRIGGRMRFVNHSCEPNCAFEKWIVRGEERCGVFAIQRVEAGHELTVDYGSSTFFARIPSSICVGRCHAEDSSGRSKCAGMRVGVCCRRHTAARSSSRWISFSSSSSYVHGDGRLDHRRPFGSYLTTFALKIACCLRCLGRLNGSFIDSWTSLLVCKCLVVRRA